MMDEKFMERLEEALIRNQEDYKRKKKLKGEKVDNLKMNKAINQRKEMKELNKIWQKKFFGEYEALRDRINKFKEQQIKAYTITKEGGFLRTS